MASRLALKKRLGIDDYDPPPKQARLGICQSFRAGNPKPSATVTKSPAKRWLVKGFAKSKFSAQELSQGAQAIAESSTDVPADVEQLARAGSKRQRTRKNKQKADDRNVSRNITRTLQQDAKLPPIYEAACPFWDHALNCRYMGTLSFLPIHEVVDSVVKEEGVSAVCSSLDAQAAIQHDLHDWGSRVGADTKDGPWTALGIWGDSGPYNTRDSVFLVHFAFLLGTISMTMRRFWVCTFSKRDICRCGCSGRCTFDVVFKVIAWSMRALLTRLWPSRDHNGQPWTTANKLRKRLGEAGEKLRVAAGMVRKFGDWQWFKQGLGLTSWAGEGLCKRMLEMPRRADFGYSLS
jgi:hypothetical protein